MLRCAQIRKHYGGIFALKGVAWELAAGEVHAARMWPGAPASE